MMRQGIPAPFWSISALNLPLFRLALCASLPLLAGCNAGAIALAYYTSHALGTQTVSGTLANPTATTKVGYVAWIELMQDGSVQGRLNFDLVQDKNVTFDKIAQPSGNKFTLDITPRAGVAEGTYVVFAWDDVNGNNIYEGDQNEKRAPEVYRVRGQATTRNLWTTEKFVFTNTKLSIDYADVNSISFTF
jgi:hypothetical protein